MTAISLSLLLFVFWAFVGFGLLAVFPSRLRVLTNMLLAPAVGLALTIVFLFIVNRWGVPVGRFAHLLLGGLGLGAAAALIWQRPLVAVKRYLPFAALILLNAYLLGRPMLKYGFDWVSFCNDDMANYCLAAARFTDHGYSDIPTAESLAAGRDMAEWYWFMHVPGMVRSGSELVLAWVARLTHLSAHQVFMPVILALNFALLSAAAALLYSSCRSWRVGFIVTLLLCGSAQMCLGVIYQLIGQVGGMCLLCANLTLWLRSVRGNALRSQLRPGILAAVLLTAQMIDYPEVLPFLGLGFFAFAALRAWRRQLAWRATGWLTVVVAATSLLLVNRYCLDSVDFLLHQAKSVSASGGDRDAIELFPFFMLPIGFSNLWGLQHLASFAQEPWQSLGIAIGFALLVATAGCAARLAWRGNAIGLLAIIMLVLGLHLYWKAAAFGLYKLGMYAQPFLFGSLVVLCLRATARPWLQALPLVLLGWANFSVVDTYVEYSEGVGTFAEVRQGSQSRVSSRFRADLATKPARRLIADTHNIVLAKFQALHTRGIPTDFLSAHFFHLFDDMSAVRSMLGATPYQAESSRIIREFDARMQPAEFALLDPNEPRKVNNFFINRVGVWDGAELEGVYFVRTTAGQTVFNRRHSPAEEGRAAELCPLSEMRNHLAFINSDLGRPYFYHKSEFREMFGFSQLESDYFYPDGTMEAVGRHLLFQVIQPTPKFRLLLDFTASLKADQQNQLPPGAVIGSERVPLPLCGRGSARVVSRPFSPQMIQGRPYVDLDLGVAGTMFPTHRTGLNKLWGADITDDRRKPVAFARDVTLITEEEYRGMVPPTVLASFPKDLSNRDLEYSGIYEEGWVGEALYAVLSRPAGNAHVVVKGDVWAGGKKLETGNEVEVLLNDRVLTKTALKPGPFELHLPVGVSSGGREKIELRFTNIYQLPGSDGRPVAARLKRLGFELNTEP